jgi:chromosome segregation ATPase
MTTDYDKAISQIKENLDKAKNMRIRAETRLEQLNKQKADIVNELEALGIKPEGLDLEITKLRKEIEDMITNINEMIPQDLIKNN